MNAIFLDCETNGKPLQYGLDYNTVDNWPRITQLSWVMVNIENQETIREQNHIIKPDVWEVPKEPFFIENNISTERCALQGIPATKAIDILFDDMEDADLFVCHNLDFDYNVVAAEIVRYGLKPPKVLTKICTMKSTIELLKLPGRNGYKFPKLQELHVYLFGCEFDGAHDALADVIATASCFLELVNRGHFKEFLQPQS